MTWTEKARDASKAKVIKVCCDCSRQYQIAVVSAPRSRRCPECQADRAQELIRKRRFERRRVRTGRVTTTYWRICVDPDGSWMPDTTLSIAEIKDLLRMRYIAPGTVLMRGDEQRMVQVDKAGELELTPPPPGVDDPEGVQQA